jgi:hypothetical protein
MQKVLETAKFFFFSQLAKCFIFQGQETLRVLLTLQGMRQSMENVGH